jgi:hypothetical protein
VQAVPQPRRRRSEATTAPSSGGTRRPFRWNWVDSYRLAPGRPRRVIDGTLADLTARGWLESNGNGKVRPTSMFPIGIIRALSLIGENG